MSYIYHFKSKHKNDRVHLDQYAIHVRTDKCSFFKIVKFKFCNMVCLWLLELAFSTSSKLSTIYQYKHILSSI